MARDKGGDTDDPHSRELLPPLVLRLRKGLGVPLDTSALVGCEEVALFAGKDEVTFKIGGFRAAPRPKLCRARMKINPVVTSAKGHVFLVQEDA